MSAFGGKSGHRSARRPRRLLTHTGSRGALFDHIVGLREQLCRHVEAKHPRSLEIDDEFEFRGLLNGKVRRLCAFQDFIHELCCATIEVSPIHSVRQLAHLGWLERAPWPTAATAADDLLRNDT